MWSEHGGLYSSFLLNCFLAAAVSLFSVHKSSYFHLSAPGVDETIPPLDNHISPSRLPRRWEGDGGNRPLPLIPTAHTVVCVRVWIALLGVSICTIIQEVGNGYRQWQATPKGVVGASVCLSAWPLCVISTACVSGWWVVWVVRSCGKHSYNEKWFRADKGFEAAVFWFLSILISISAFECGDWKSSLGLLMFQERAATYVFCCTYVLRLREKICKVSFRICNPESSANRQSG